MDFDEVHKPSRLGPLARCPFANFPQPLYVFPRREMHMSRRSSLQSLILPLVLVLFYSLFATAQAKPVDAEGE